MQPLSSFKNLTAILPINYSFTSLLVKRVDVQLKAGRYVVGSVNLAVFGFFAGVGSSGYHTLALVKTPAVVLKLTTRITIFQLPFIGRKLDEKLPSLPKGFEYSAPFIHALKVVVCAFSAFFTPFCGVFLAPKAAIWLNQLLGIVEKQEPEPHQVVRIVEEQEPASVSPSNGVPPPPPPPSTPPRSAATPVRTRADRPTSPKIRQSSSTGLVSPQNLQESRASLCMSPSDGLAGAGSPGGDLTPSSPALIVDPDALRNATRNLRAVKTLPPSSQLASPLIPDAKAVQNARNSLRPISQSPKSTPPVSPQNDHVSMLQERVRSTLKAVGVQQNDDDESNDDRKWSDPAPPELGPRLESSAVVSRNNSHTPVGSLTRSQSFRASPIQGSSSAELFAKLEARRNRFEPPN